MCFAPGSTSAFGPVAEKHPQLQLILDHMGVSGAMPPDKVAEGIGQTAALAKYPNVSAKVSASPGLSRQPYPFKDVADYVKRVFDAYGPQRSYWGTDITNSYAKASYRQRITRRMGQESGVLDGCAPRWRGVDVVAGARLRGIYPWWYHAGCRPHLTFACLICASSRPPGLTYRDDFALRDATWNEDGRSPVSSHLHGNELARQWASRPSLRLRGMA
jgi:hypothetical protein